MNLPEKDKFVHSIVDDLKKSILAKVDQMPDNWDGLEIRQFIKDYYTQHYAHVGTAFTGKRKKEYNNEILINNLI